MGLLFSWAGSNVPPFSRIHEFLQGPNWRIKKSLNKDHYLWWHLHHFLIRCSVNSVINLLTWLNWEPFHFPISGLSILFHWLRGLSCQYYTLYYSFVGFEIWAGKYSNFIILFQDCFDYWVLYTSRWILGLVCSFLQNSQLGLWYYVESIDQFGGYCYPTNIKSSG